MYINFLSPSGQLAYLEIWKGRPRGYISGVHFQKCSKFSTFFTLNISTKIHLQMVRVGQTQGPPKFRPRCLLYCLLYSRSLGISAIKRIYFCFQTVHGKNPCTYPVLSVWYTPMWFDVVWSYYAQRAPPWCYYAANMQLLTNYLAIICRGQEIMKSLFTELGRMGHWTWTSLAGERGWGGGARTSDLTFSTCVRDLFRIQEGYWLNNTQVCKCRLKMLTPILHINIM